MEKISHRPTRISATEFTDRIKKWPDNVVESKLDKYHRQAFRGHLKLGLGTGLLLSGVHLSATGYTLPGLIAAWAGFTLNAVSVFPTFDYSVSAKVLKDELSTRGYQVKGFFSKNIKKSS